MKIIVNSSLKYLVISILLKGRSGTKNFLSIYPLPALLIAVPRIPFTNEEITSFTFEVDEGAKKVGRNTPSCFLGVFFHVLLFQ